MYVAVRKIRTSELPGAGLLHIKLNLRQDPLLER
jgi:hypothetical protein